jgi:hypothetical protein
MSSLLLFLVACGDPESAPQASPPRDGESCDVITQDCADGLRCTVSQDELAVPVWWAHADYVAPVTPAVCLASKGAAAIGDACTADPVSGSDSCAAGGFCFTTDRDRTSGMCVALCNPASTTCADEGLPDDACFGSYSGAPGFCFQPAGLGDTDCPAGTAPTWWYAFPTDLAVGCIPYGDAGAGEACAPGACAPGFGCVHGACQQYCSAETADACPDHYCAFVDVRFEPYGICWSTD